MLPCTRAKLSPVSIGGFGSLADSQSHILIASVGSLLRILADRQASCNNSHSQIPGSMFSRSLVVKV